MISIGSLPKQDKDVILNQFLSKEVFEESGRKNFSLGKKLLTVEQIKQGIEKQIDLSDNKIDSCL